MLLTKYKMYNFYTMNYDISFGVYWGMQVLTQFTEATMYNHVSIFATDPDIMTLTYTLTTIKLV